jgi:uncharacterized Zn finger protein|tara:strand:- start:185 stop:430 length:246 start_codon:yes stop_codon:yes gene_type:complete
MDNNLGNALKGMSPSDLPDVVCNECGNPTFRQVVLLKKVSAALSPSGNTSFLPMPVFECSNCGHVNDELLPKPGGSPLSKA